MWLFDWISGLVSNILALWKTKSGNILFLGLEDAGKTSLLYMLKYGKMAQHNPTCYANKEEITIAKITLTTYDLGGHKTARKVWKQYFPAVNGIVFMVDAFKQKKFDESRIELEGILADDQIANIPVLILGNKIDQPGAASEDELRTAFDLHGLTTGKSNTSPMKRPVELFMCSVLKEQGYGEGFIWLSQYIPLNC